MAPLPSQQSRRNYNLTLHSNGWCSYFPWFLIKLINALYCTSLDSRRFDSHNPAVIGTLLCPHLLKIAAFNSSPLPVRRQNVVQAVAHQHSRHRHDLCRKYNTYTVFARSSEQVMNSLDRSIRLPRASRLAMAHPGWAMGGTNPPSESRRMKVPCWTETRVSRRTAAER